MIKLHKVPPIIMALFQAIGLVGYISIVGNFIINGEKIFGPMPDSSGPVLFLTLFATSALICGIISLAYPVWAFWEEKNTKRALTIIAFEAFFMVAITLFIILLNLAS